MWAKSYFSAKFPLPTAPPPLHSCLALFKGHSVLSQASLFSFVLLFTLMFSFPFPLHPSQRLNNVVHANTQSPSCCWADLDTYPCSSSQARLQDSKCTLREWLAVDKGMVSSGLLNLPEYPHTSMGLVAMGEDLNQTLVLPESQLETMRDTTGI